MNEIYYLQALIDGVEVASVCTRNKLVADAIFSALKSVDDVSSVTFDLIIDFYKKGE